MNDNIIYTKKSQVWQLFNDFFALVGKIVRGAVPLPSSEDEFSNYHHENQLNTPFTFSSVQVSEVESLILSLNGKKLNYLLIPTKFKNLNVTQYRLC